MHVLIFLLFFIICRMEKQNVSWYLRQASVLHDKVANAGPSQDNLPTEIATGLVQTLVAVFVPPPQIALQKLHSVHWPQTTWMGAIYNVYLILSS